MEDDGFVTFDPSLSFVHDSCTYIELRGIYDGWSVRWHADGRMENRWLVGDKKYAPTQKFIEENQDRMNEERRNDE